MVPFRVPPFPTASLGWKKSGRGWIWWLGTSRPTTFIEAHSSRRYGNLLLRKVINACFPPLRRYKRVLLCKVIVTFTPHSAGRVARTRISTRAAAAGSQKPMRRARGGSHVTSARRACVRRAGAAAPAGTAPTTRGVCCTARWRDPSQKMSTLI